MLRYAFSLDWLKAGKSMLARMAMMAMTTSSSIKVKPKRLEVRTPCRRPLRRTAPGQGIVTESGAGKEGMPELRGWAYRASRKYTFPGPMGTVIW